jgi:hypothetical protein
MKTIVGLVIGLLIGSILGWCFGYTRPIAKASREAQQEMHNVEVDDSMAAIIAVKTIPFVEAGETNKAIQWLVKPVGSYYRVYATRAGTNEERLRLRTMIEQLASTNQMVNAEIHRKVE